MPLKGRYPNDVYMVDLVGEKRSEYMRSLSGLYNDLKGKGYPVPGASVVDEGSDVSYVLFEGVSGESLDELVSGGSVDKSVATGVYKRVMEKLSELKLKEGVVVYNMHQGKICYDVDKDGFMICDFSRNSKMDVYGRVEKFTPEYLEEMRLKNEEREKENESL